MSKSNVHELNAIDTDEFRIPGRDNMGHSVRLFFRTFPGDAEQISAIIQGKYFPYESQSHLIRHALHKHLNWLHRLKHLGKLRSVKAANEAMLSLLKEDEYFTEYKDVFDKLSIRLNHHKGQGDFGEARRLLLEFVNCINSMPEGFWKEKYIKRLRHDHKDLLDTMEKANLANFGE